MPSHHKKADYVWKRELTEFAQSKKPSLGRGGQPRGGKWLEEYKKILKCPWENFDGFQAAMRTAAKRDALKVVAKATQFHERNAGDDMLKSLFSDDMILSIYSSE